VSETPVLSIRPTRPEGVALSGLIASLGLTVQGSVKDLVATGVTLDSRDVHSGDLYVGMPGAHRHGAEFAEAAAKRGAVAILTDVAGSQCAEGSPLPVLITEASPRDVLGEVSALVYGTGDMDALIFGVTGTNGKTSVVYLLAELLRAAGIKAGLSSTAERRIGNTVITSDLTTPEASELHGLLARMREEEVGGIALEVSAQATKRHRVDGIRFDVVAFNNFSQDHLDEFGTLEEYFAAKQALFTPRHAACGVVVIDGEWGQKLARECHIPVVTLATEYGRNADWYLAITRQSLDGISFVLQGPAGANFRGRLPVFGRFMAENAALALIMLHEAGVSLDQVAAGLDNGHIPVYIPGRLEEITNGAPGPRFFVDYGHTPGSFTAMLDALDEVIDGRIIFLFGADGDRDTSKRAQMGRIAAAGSQVVIICDYHPRTEDPAAIRAQLVAGARSAGGRAEILEIPDPREAVRTAIALAGDGDVIVYAGPGHEEYQEVAGTHIPYSARDEVRGALREAGLLT
jgi:UDP-N-acetylmuramoyl-L-alanyl-D-glutamate--2,6-diaminopimelate ligase